jgi:hypothetical protein
VITRYLASPVVIMATGAARVAAINAAAEHIEFVSVRVQSVLRDTDGDVSSRGTVLVALREPVLADPDGRVRAVLHDAAQHRIDEKPFALMYLRRDKPLGVFVPAIGVRSIEPAAGAEDAGRAIGEIAHRAGTRLETGANLALAAFAVRAKNDDARYEAYLRALELCPAFTYEVLLAAQRSGKPADFLNWEPRCMQRARVRSL